MVCRFPSWYSAGKAVSESLKGVSSGRVGMGRSPPGILGGAAYSAVGFAFFSLMKSHCRLESWALRRGFGLS